MKTMHYPVLFAGIILLKQPGAGNLKCEWV